MGREAQAAGIGGSLQGPCSEKRKSGRGETGARGGEENQKKKCQKKNPSNPERELLCGGESSRVGGGLRWGRTERMWEKGEKQRGGRLEKLGISWEQLKNNHNNSEKQKTGEAPREKARVIEYSEKKKENRPSKTRGTLKKQKN